MAELAVSSALTLAEIVLPFLQKLYQSGDLLEEIRRMKGWLVPMKAFIEDCNDVPERRSVRLKHQVEEFRDIAYEIEDVLDEFILHSPNIFHSHRITQKVHELAHNIKHKFLLRGIGPKIANINQRIDDIKSQNAAFVAGPSHSASASSSPIGIRHRVSPLLLDDEMYGYENQRRELIGCLMDGERRLVALAIVGPAGSGKTTFVKNAYWKEGIQGQFDCHAWVHVSRHFFIEELLVNILEQFCLSRNEMYNNDDRSHPQEKLMNYLARKRYIVVLDDVWKPEHWDRITGAFPRATYGSRIVVTTRDSNVANRCATSAPYLINLNGIEWSEAWRLFCKKVFQDNDGECPVELKDWSIKIVKRCEGLPLAIVAAAGALARKSKFPNEWEKFHNNFGKDSDDHLSVIQNTLQPGYLDLSSNLKSCFLYFGIFPEDYCVEYKKLIRLWVAERFVMETNYKTAEEVAFEYLNELIHRNLVHVPKWDFDDRPKSCRVLNPVHSFIIQKCKDENFAYVCSNGNISPSHKIRRMSVQGDFTKLLPTIDLAGVRTLFLFRCGNSSPTDIWNNSKSFVMSRVLDFQGAPLIKFPDQISYLTLLRSLCLRDTKIQKIPGSIDKLPHLEILDLKQTDVIDLPKEISHLRNLRHLFAYKYNVSKYVEFESVSGVKISKGIGSLTHLQSLSLVRIDQKAGIIEDLKNLIQLRKLGLLGLMRHHGIGLCGSIEGMKNITTLDLCSATKDEYLDLEAMGNPPRSLERLYLKGRMRKTPTWISALDNLVRIGFKWSKMEESPLKVLQYLPNLLELQMVDCFIGGVLVFEASSLKKLKILLIEDLLELHTIVIEQGSIPRILQMSLRRCPELKIPPLGMQTLVNLNELVMYDMAKEFIDRIRSNGEDREMVEHIATIHSLTLNGQNWLFENLSESFYKRKDDLSHASTSQ